MTGICDYYPGGSRFHSALRFSPAAYTFTPPTGQGVEPNTWLLRYQDAATTRDGQSVTLEARNASEYRPANLGSNGFNGDQGLYQFNLRVAFDPTGVEQPFLAAAERIGFNLSLCVPLSIEHRSRACFQASCCHHPNL